jgi:cytoskeletal protein CcmA (bactofilin family)
MVDDANDLGVHKNSVSKEEAPQRQAERPRSGPEQADLKESPRKSALLRAESNAAEVIGRQRAADLARPGSEAAHAAALSSRSDWQTGSADSQVDARTLMVGPGVSFSGDLSSCDHLVVEGRVEANIDDCENMMIAETGVFRGNGSTENADVRGRIDGEFLARKRLLIRGSGYVSGTITYGEIEIEAGGKISGTIQAP